MVYYDIIIDDLMDDSLKPEPSIPWKTDLPLKKLKETHPRET
jgi:hypothetical protein